MGTVYLARRHGMGGFRREVALKVMHAHLRNAPGFSAAIIEEARIAGRIRHPNVVPVLDVGMDGSGVYLVMDYVEGDSLSGLHRVAKATQRVIPMGIALRVFVDALAGLHAAHELRDERGQSVGLIHRDFSPQNILVGIDGMTRLTDFGVAKARTNLEQTNVGLLKGKLRYMSPEQIRCEPLDRRCDVWAAGVVAWEMLAGRRLHQGKPEATTMLQAVSKPPPKVRTVRPDVPVGLEQVVGWALQLKPEDRCPTAKHLAERLSKAARQVDWLADREEVAEFVSSLVGEVLVTRRQQVSEVRKLREEITAIRSSAVVAEPAPSDSDLVPVARAEPEDASTVRVAAALLQEEDEPDSETTRQLMRPPAAVSAPFEVREETTDMHSATDGFRLPTHKVVGRVVPSLVVALALLTGVVVVRECTRTPEAGLVSAGEADDGIQGPTAAGRESDAPSESSTAKAAARSDNPTLTIKADVPVAVLQIGDREFSFDSPTRELAVPLTLSETESTVQVTATSADGRRISAELDAGETSLNLRFPQQAGRPAIKPSPRPKPATAPAAPPLATNPYLRNNR